MKKAMLLFFILLVGIPSISQKQTKEKCGKLEYILPPTDYSLSDFKTYYLAIQVPSNETELKGKMASRVKFGLFERIKTKDADFTVRYQLYSLIYQPVKVKTIPKESNKDGVKKKYNMYDAYADYSFQMEAKIILNDGTVHYSDMISGSGTYRTRELSSVDQAKSFYNSGLKKNKEGITSGAVNSMNIVMADKYAHVKGIKHFEIVGVKPKKFDYDDFNEGIQLCTKAVELYNVGNLATNESAELCRKAIELWQKELTQSNLEDKKARINVKLTGALYYNIGMAYFLMEEYDKAISNLEKAKEIAGNVISVHYVWQNLAVDIAARLANKN